MEIEKQPVSIITSVTLGKEVHAGHALLLATADLARRGVGLREPLNLVNNNTGPRAAGALVSFAQRTGLSLEDAAGVLTEGIVAPEDIISAYRSRIESGDDFIKAFQMLDMGGFDIFNPVAKKVNLSLKSAGFNVDVVPETRFIPLEQQVLQAVNPCWYGSGFNFLSSDKGIRVLQKSGQLTATGKALLSMFGASKDEIEKKRLVVFVDGSADTTAAVATFNSVFGKAMQIPGAAIGFNGKMASGTNGEAMTLSQLIDVLKEQYPAENLSKALRQMILTKPLTMRTNNLADAFYDFEDNAAFVRSLIVCFEEAKEFEIKVMNAMECLDAKVTGEAKTTGRRNKMFLQYLPQKYEALLQASPEDILMPMKKATRSIRENFFMKILQSITTSHLESIVSLTRGDCDILQGMIRHCMGRLGYETK